MYLIELRSNGDSSKFAKGRATEADYKYLRSRQIEGGPFRFIMEVVEDGVEGPSDIDDFVLFLERHIFIPEKPKEKKVEYNLETYIIQKSDMRFGSGPRVLRKCDCCGHTTAEYPLSGIGRVMPNDVGRMMKRSKSGKWYLESFDDFKKRTQE